MSCFVKATKLSHTEMFSGFSPIDFSVAVLSMTGNHESDVNEAPSESHVAGAADVDSGI